MLNIPTQSFPAPSSQQRISPSGQSERNKVALKPGHSLMDWIRFAKSGKDLTGLSGRIIEVTQEELQKHNSRGDCWTCIRGMVYNVTPYIDYHPGGEEELMKAAGIDATDLFDQVHRWVNYESMLKECLVGRLATKAAAAHKAATPASPPTGLAPPAAVPPPSNRDPKPRFDWFQTDATVHLVVYAKRKIPSSGCTTVDLQAGVLRVEVLLGKMSFMIHLCLASPVEENIAVHSAVSVGKIQVTMHKQTKEKWKSLGQPLEFHNTFLCKKDRALFYRDCVLASKAEVNHNSQLFRLHFPQGTVLQVPVGRHVFLKALIQAHPLIHQNLIYKCDDFLYIQWRSQLSELAAKDERFQVEHILSEPSDSWTNRTGRVDEAMLKELLVRPSGSRCYVCVCGPSAFTELTVRLLKQLGFSEEELHTFQG
uniref:Cytochrome b5 reductase 4 n=1 Tax=Nothobranchius rachovii TaxID=451742 RepID=A0A1A8S5U7_9TELE